MKTSLAAVVGADEVLATLTNTKFPAPVAIKIYRLAKTVHGEAEAFHVKRSELVKHYGTERPTTNEERAVYGETVFTVPPEKMSAFTKDFSELLAVEIDFTAEPLSLSSLGDTSLSIGDIDKLGPFIQLDK